MSFTCAYKYNKMSNILTNLLKETSPSRLIILPCVCFASIYASTAAKSFILNYIWTAANFIVEGRGVVHHCSSSTCALQVIQIS